MATGSDTSIESIPVKPWSAVITPSAAALRMEAVIDPPCEAISEDTSSADCRRANLAASQASSGEHSTVKVTSKTT
jgi:hypothetical protein